MARLKWVLLAQLATVDKQTNALSLASLLEELTVPAEVEEPPPGKAIGLGPPFYLVMSWVRDNPEKPEKQIARMRIRGPADGKELGSSEAEIDLTGTNTRARAILKIPFLPYRGHGPYQFEIQLKTGPGKSWRKAGEVTVLVKKAGAVAT